jgi:hypothetical protein
LLGRRALDQRRQSAGRRRPRSLDQRNRSRILAGAGHAAHGVENAEGVDSVTRSAGGTISQTPRFSAQNRTWRLTKLKVTGGDAVYIAETPDGFSVSPYDPEFEGDMERAKAIIKKRRNMHRELAKR